MHEVVGDLWDVHAAGEVVAITTNGMVTKSGKSIMLRGCARQAAIRYPEILKIHGVLLLNHGNHVFDLGRRVVSFPVEEDPYQNPNVRLIEQSCKELVELVDYRGWQKVFVPRPGCGGGGLAWSEVRPIVDKYFDDRFYVISMED
jgi:hypothetical protein